LELKTPERNLAILRLSWRESRVDRTVFPRRCSPGTVVCVWCRQQNVSAPRTTSSCFCLPAA